MAEDLYANEWLIHGVSLETSSEEHNISCTEGSIWYEKCNECRCEGGSASCTEMWCGDGDFSDLDGTCEGNSSWKIDCNWCYCDQGRGYCTQMFCFSSEGLHDIFCINFFFSFYYIQ